MSKCWSADERAWFEMYGITPSGGSQAVPVAQRNPDSYVGAEAGAVLGVLGLLGVGWYFHSVNKAKLKAAVLEAKIRNLEIRAANSSGTIQAFYLNELNKLRAQ